MKKRIIFTYFVKTGNCEPIMLRRAKRRPRVDKHSTIRRRVASFGHQFVESDGAFPLATFCIKCLISLMWSCLSHVDGGRKKRKKNDEKNFNIEHSFAGQKNNSIKEYLKEESTNMV